MTNTTAAVSPLRHRMINEMIVRNLSPATQRSYIHAVKRFSLLHSRSPDQRLIRSRSGDALHRPHHPDCRERSLGVTLQHDMKE